MQVRVGDLWVNNSTKEKQVKHFLKPLIISPNLLLNCTHIYRLFSWNVVASRWLNRVKDYIYFFNEKDISYICVGNYLKVLLMMWAVVPGSKVVNTLTTLTLCPHWHFEMSDFAAPMNVHASEQTHSLLCEMVSKWNFDWHPLPPLLFIILW